MKIHWALRLLAAAGTGYLWSLGFAPHSLAGACWAVIALLLLLCFRVKGWLAAGCGFAFGAVFHAASLPWVYTVMRLHGNLEVLPAAGVMALMVACLALFPAAFCWSFAWVSARSMNRALAAAPFLWVAWEYGQTHIPALGFPWNLAGYVAAQHYGLLQVATVTGIYGLSFVTVASGAVAAWVVLGTKKPATLVLRLAIAIGIALAILVPTQVGVQSVRLREPEHVAYLVQANFPEAPEYPRNWMDLHAGEMGELERISVEAAKKQPGLIVWPEVPAPFYFLDPKFAARAERVARNSGSFFLAGVVEWRPGADNRLLPYNSAVLLDPAGKRVFQYDKIHLVPFGEYVPLRRVLRFAEHLVAEVGDYQAGTTCNTGELPDEPAPWEMRTPQRPRKFGVFICYEAIFAGEVRRFVANGAELLINLSNDGWYGRSAAPEQHLAMARVRAVENRRWLLRATNNGYTVAIDPYGREAARMPPDIRGVLRAPYSFRSGRTMYARWGNWFAWVCVVAGAGLLLWPVRRED